MKPIISDINVQLARKSYKNLRHGAHVMLWAKTETKLFDEIPLNSLVLMTMRFDGFLGFPGGFVDPGEEIEVGLAREMKEEIGVDAEDVNVTGEDQIASHLVTNRFQGDDICLHFFMKRISENSFLKIERNVTRAADFGTETLGIFRVPLYSLNSDRGLPAFLKNNFVGNAKAQLLLGLKSAGILSSETLDKYRTISQN